MPRDDLDDVRRADKCFQRNLLDACSIRHKMQRRIDMCAEVRGQGDRAEAVILAAFVSHELLHDQTRIAGEWRSGFIERQGDVEPREGGFSEFYCPRKYARSDALRRAGVLSKRMPEAITICLLPRTKQNEKSGDKKNRVAHPCADKRSK